MVQKIYSQNKIKLPKQKKQIEPDERQKKYERSMQRMFTLD